MLQWDPNRPNSLATFLGHTQLVYNAMWSPHVPSCFASVSGKYYYEQGCIHSMQGNNSEQLNKHSTKQDGVMVIL